MAGGDTPTDATEVLADVQVGLGEARDGQADRATREGADAEASRSIAFGHRVDGTDWTVHVAPSTADGHLRDEGFAGTPERRDMENWVAANRPAIERAAETKIAAGATTDTDVWVHSRDLG